MTSSSKLRRSISIFSRKMNNNNLPNGYKKSKKSKRNRLKGLKSLFSRKKKYTPLKNSINGELNNYVWFDNKQQPTTTNPNPTKPFFTRKKTQNSNTSSINLNYGV